MSDSVIDSILGDLDAARAERDRYFRALSELQDKSKRRESELIATLRNLTAAVRKDFGVGQAAVEAEEILKKYGA